MQPLLGMGNHLNKENKMKNNRFAKGSGVYVCQFCGRLTRKTGDGANVGSCELCYEIAGYENQMSDSEVGSENYVEAEKQLVILNRKLETRNFLKGL